MRVYFDWHGNPIVERADGSISTLAEFEADCRRPILIAKCLEDGRQLKRARQHRLSEHAPWDIATSRCARCGMTSQQFYAVPYGYGLPCDPTDAPPEPK